MAGEPMDPRGVTRSESGRETYYPDGLRPPVEASAQASKTSLSPSSAKESAVDLDEFDKSSGDLSRRDNLRSTSSSTIATEPEANPSTTRPTSAHGASESLGRPRSRFSHISHLRDEEDDDDNIDMEKQASRLPDQNTPEKDPNLIEWDGPDDPENPQNWSRMKKWVITIVLGFVTFCITFASSVFSTATLQTSMQFGVSTEVMTLGTSLFVLGFAVGPPIWGPLSELYGRKYPLFIGFFIFAIFQIPVAVAQNLQTIMVCRFFGGVFGSAPLGIVGGQLTDFWGALDRGVAITIFAMATFIGPVAGPVMGGFIVQSHLGWRWTAYITLIMAAFFGAIGFLVVPESYGPVILSRRASKIRFETKNWAIHAKSDEQQVDLSNIVEKYLLRPFTMLLREPILDLITLYMAIIYGIMYLFFTAYPIAFQEDRGWNPGVGALPFLSITLGVCLGGAIIVIHTRTRFARKLLENGRVNPEERLIPMIIGGILFPIGMFWFAWTSNKNISWVPQVIAGVPIGAGVLIIFLQGLNYIIDVYLMYANSAIAANTFCRSLFGAGFPLFATAMYHTLGVDWASTLLACLTTLLAPVPVLFYFYGERIRGLSRYSPTGAGK